MNSDFAVIGKVIIRIVTPYIICLLIGVVIFGESVFTPHLVTFEFVLAGAMGAIFLGLLYTTKVRYALFVFIILLLIDIIVINTMPSFSWVLRDLLYDGALGASIYLFWKYPYKFEWAYIVRSLQIASYLSLANVTALSLIALYHNAFAMVSAGVTEVLFIGFLIGLGLGIGNELANLLIKKLEKTAVQEEVK